VREEVLIMHIPYVVSVVSSLRACETIQ
jgi:hypothetical protein